MRSKWARTVVVTLALACGFMYTSEPLQVDAKTSAQMIQKKAEIDKKIKKLNKEIKQLQKKLDKKQQEYGKTVNDISETNKEIKETEKNIEERSTIIEDRLKAYQNQDNTISPYVEAVLGADSFADAVSRTVSVKTILDADQNLLDDQKADKKKLAEEKQALQDKQAKLQQQFQEMQDEENHLETKKAENKAKSLKLKEQIATKKQQEKLERERKKREEEAKRLKALQEKQFLEAKKLKAASISETSNSVQQNLGDAGNGTNGAKVTDSDQKAPSVSGSGSAKAAIAEASKFLGRAYVWGGSNPSTGFDCSGLTQWSFKQAGVSLPRTAAQQYLATKKVSASEAKAGDLVFFSYGSGVAHVGIYLGGGRMLDAQNNGVVVESLDWWNKYLVGYGRIAGVN
ncbi:NlpC/P60 family protein [Rummeliibacillus pycnus]|uniref:C40 family peptidase n=1 Tax=Rummeliibacillus pycnus TaxID=101070 RepID=UPI003D2C2A7A